MLSVSSTTFVCVFNCVSAYKLFFYSYSFDPFVRGVCSPYTVHANAHMHNCLRDRNEGTEDSAVAVTAAPNDVSYVAVVLPL